MIKQHYVDIAQNQDKFWWYIGMKAINKSLLDKYFPKRSDLKILDAGCGPGAMLPLLSEYGDVIGVDMSEDALKYARKRGKVKKGDISNLDFPDNSFDLVVCMDVLYHTWVEDELKALSEFNRVLKKGGILLVREPAFEWLKGNEDRGSLTKRRFEKSTLELMLKKESFEILKSSYVNFLLFPIFLFVRMMTKFSGGDKSSDMVEPPYIINQILIYLLKLEALLLQYVNFPIGSSVICVAKKK